MYKPSTTYTVIFNVTENTLDENFTLLTESSSAILCVNIENEIIVSCGQIGLINKAITTASDLTGRSYVFPTGISTATSGSITYLFMILEGDYTNIDLPDDINNIESVSGNLIMTSSDLDENADNITYENIELCRIGDVFDSICDSQLIQRIGTRDYIEGDLDLENVLVDNDLTTTYYILDEPIITELDTKEIKTYDGTTHITSSGSNVSPIISARISSDVGAVIASVSAENQQLMIENQALTNELSETNEILDTLLTVE